MLLPTMLLLLLPQSTAVQSSAPGALTCGVRDAQTDPLRSSAGYTAVLKMHSEDDHGKNSHLCEADFSLQIIRHDSSTGEPFSLLVSDAEWDRPIAFRIEGFSQDGHSVFVFISEDKYSGSIDAIEFDMSSGARTKEVFLDSHFIRRLSPARAATLRIVGISPTGLMVLGSNAINGCAHMDMWQVSLNKTTGPKGGAVLPEYPKRLSSSKWIAMLTPGILMKP